MRIQSEIFTPITLTIFSLSISIVAWLMPDFKLIYKGYEVPSEISVQSLLLLFDWYMLIIFGFYLGNLIGKERFMKIIIPIRIVSLENKKIYYSFTILSVIGLLVTYYKIFKNIPSNEIFIAFLDGGGNILKEILYEQYSFGFVSLRYLVIYSSSLSLYKFYSDKKLTLLFLLNTIMLFSIAIISSRLIFVSTIMVSIFLYIVSVKKIKIKIFKILIYCLIVFIILSILNYTRNASYYASKDLFFLGGGISSITSYLASPFQASIAAANNIMDIANTELETYRKFVDLDISLSTNSAFVHINEELGVLGWLYIFILTVVVGALFSLLKSYGKTALLLPCGGILYACSELWRIDLFRQGIFLVWLVFGISIPIIISFIENMKYKNKMI
jgi:hypothetical protein